MSISRQDKIRGSLLGGAIGDALGYPVEFMSYSQIKSKFGENGITRFELNKDGVAEISDDTQMTLFTANGLLFGHTRGAMRGIMANPEDYIRDAYVEWWQVQTDNIDYTAWHSDWIREVKELHSKRAPGNTCMQALQAISFHENVSNNSKGCGGVMRIASIPLFYNGMKDHDKSHLINYNQNVVDEIVRAAGETAKITHKHPLGWIPAALLAFIIDEMLDCEKSEITSYRFALVVDNGIKLIKRKYPEQIKYILQLQYLLEKAARRAISPLSDEEAIRQIGEGWVADEALAIAVFCVMRYPNDFERAIIASVNHSGDSDSTGSITGNIIGALLGVSAIPTCYKEHLELKWLVEELADDLALGIPVSEYADNYDTPEKLRWIDKYIESPSMDVVPIRNSYLVDRELGIYAGEYPGDKDENKCRIKLHSWSNFKYFYDLTVFGELNPYNQHLNSQQLYERFPIPDCGIPQDTNSVARLLDEIIYRCKGNSEDMKRGYEKSVKREYEKTYIHCWGGVGRTGTIVACYYAYRMKGNGYTIDEIYRKALDMLADSFSRCPKSKYRISPENQQQRDFIKKFIANECM